MEWHLENHFTFRVGTQFRDGKSPPQWHRAANIKQVIQVKSREVCLLLKNFILSKTAILMYFANYILSICFFLKKDFPSQED